MPSAGRFLFVCGLSLGLTMGAALAPAHDAFLYYGAWWKPTVRVVGYDFIDPAPGYNTTTRVWTSTEKQRLRESVGQWNSIVSTFQYQEGPLLIEPYDPRLCSPAPEQNGVWWFPIDGQFNPNTGDGEIAGLAVVCVYSADSTSIYSFNIRFDQDENWSFSTSGPGSSQTDFRSVASHELGHGNGFLHFFEDDQTACPESSSRSTMCPSIVLGTSYMWTLATHDIHTFDQVY